MQNAFYQLLKSVYPEMASSEQEDARVWAADFSKLGEMLGISMQQLAPPEEPAISAA